MKIEEIEKDFNYKYQIKEMDEYKDGDFERLNYENPQEVVLNFISQIHTQALKQGREEILACLPERKEELSYDTYQFLDRHDRESYGIEVTGFNSHHDQFISNLKQKKLI